MGGGGRTFAALWAAGAVLACPAVAFAWPRIPTLFPGSRASLAPVFQPATWLAEEQFSRQFSDQGRLLAFADLNGDGVTDFLFATVEGPPYEIYALTATAAPVGTPESAAKNARHYRKTASFEVPGPVLSITAAEVDNDAKQDVIVHVAANAKSPDAGGPILVYSQQSENSFELIYRSPNEKYIQRFVQLDANFDGYADLMAEVSSAGGPRQRMLLINDKTGKFTWHSFREHGKLHFRDDFEDADAHLAPRHSSALIDVNGDCVPDLVLDTVSSEGGRRLEMWLALEELEVGPPLSQPQLPTGISEESTVGGGDAESLSPQVVGVSFFQTRPRRWATKRGTTARGNQSRRPPSHPFFQRSLDHEMLLDAKRIQSQFAFADFNGDGTMDIAYIRTRSSRDDSLELVISQNFQRPVCKSMFPLLPAPFRQLEGQKHCVPVHLLCGEGEDSVLPSFRFAFDEEELIKIPLELSSGPIRKIHSGTFYPPALRVADLDADGFPDLSAVVVAGDGKRVSLFFHNRLGSIVGSGGVVSMSMIKARDEAAASGGGGAMPFFALTSLESPRGLQPEAQAYLDLRGIGRLDLILVNSGASVWWHSLVHKSAVEDQVAVFANGAKSEDALQLQVAAACPVRDGETGGSWAPTAAIERYNSSTGWRLQYGAPAFGAALKVASTDADGAAVVRAISLNPSPASVAALAQPFAYCGLGLAHNYVDFLYYGALPAVAPRPPAPGAATAVVTTGNYARWGAVIPNAFVLVLPRTRAVEEGPSSWTLQLLVTPSRENVVAILVASTAVLAVTALAILVLELRERLCNLISANRIATLTSERLLDFFVFSKERAARPASGQFNMMGDCFWREKKLAVQKAGEQKAGFLQAEDSKELQGFRRHFITLRGGRGA